MVKLVKLTAYERETLLRADQSLLGSTPASKDRSASLVRRKLATRSANGAEVVITDKGRAAIRAVMDEFARKEKKRAEARERKRLRITPAQARDLERVKKAGEAVISRPSARVLARKGLVTLGESYAYATVPELGASFGAKAKRGQVAKKVT